MAKKAIITGHFDSRAELEAFIIQSRKEGIRWNKIAQDAGVKVSFCRFLYYAKVRGEITKVSAHKYPKEAIATCLNCQLSDCKPQSNRCVYHQKFSGNFTTNVRQNTCGTPIKRTNDGSLEKLSKAADRVMREMGIKLDPNDFTKGAYHNEYDQKDSY